jgi:hypothetical protein
MLRPTLFLCLLGLHFATALSSMSSSSIPCRVRVPAVATMTQSLSRTSLSKALTGRNGALMSRGGALNQAQGSSEAVKCPFTKFSKLASSIYGTGGVLYILSKAIRRVLPIALEPFSEGATPLTQLQLWYVQWRMQNVLEIGRFLDCPHSKDHCSSLIAHLLVNNNKFDF